VKFKSHLYYEDKDKITETLKNLHILQGSRIEFFKNGQSQGVAFEDIYAGSYFPAISIHKSATVSVNFGPAFKYPEVLSEQKAKGVSYRNSFPGCLAFTQQFFPDARPRRGADHGAVLSRHPLPHRTRWTPATG